MADVVLQYKKATTKDQSGLPLSTGQVLLRAEDNSYVTSVVFTDLAFVPMLTHFSEELRRHPETRAVIERTDREGLLPMVLDEPLTALLRQDVEKAAEAMQYTAAPRIHHAQTVLPPVLLVGHDTLADAFGDALYCRARTSLQEVECPACGRWQRWLTPFQCTVCAFAVVITRTGHYRWGCVRTEDLLAVTPPPSRFFFPRGWNEGRNWIEYTDLQRMYVTYMQEKNAS